MSKHDLAASVRQKLLKEAQNQGRPFQELLQYYAMERFLFRLSKYNHADLFVLKGALLMIAWQAPQSRPTVDIDLAARTSNELDHIQQIIIEVCSIAGEPDGIQFNPATIQVTRIQEDAEYEGIRARFQETLSRAQIEMQIDVGLVLRPDSARICQYLDPASRSGMTACRLRFSFVQSDPPCS